MAALAYDQVGSVEDAEDTSVVSTGASEASRERSDQTNLTKQSFSTSVVLGEVVRGAQSNFVMGLTVDGSDAMQGDGFIVPSQNGDSEALDISAFALPGAQVVPPSLILYS
jgi:hypothetical protein